MENEKKPLPLDSEACYAALSAHDHRFDGRFFVGVSSTGIYCRPICRVKLPRKENCTFFTSAAAAEAADYRPCLKCRPELAPGNSSMEAMGKTAGKAAVQIEEGLLEEQSLSELAQKLGITDRHLRRSFFKEFGVTPVQYLQTVKLLLAKKLLTETRISMTEVAMASGFGSIRRFNDLFKKQYRMTPGDLRKTEKSKNDGNDEITLTLAYRPPYAWDKMLNFLSVRAIPGVEEVSNGHYRRTVAIRKKKSLLIGWISVTNQSRSNSLSATITTSLLPVLPQILTKLRTLFDTNCNPLEIYEKLRVMNKISPDLCVPGIRLPGCFDPFEMSVRAILGQQITVKAAKTLAMRFCNSFGQKIVTPFDELRVIFPEPENVIELDTPIADQLGPLGITGARCQSILSLAKALAANEINLSHGIDPETEMEKLLKLPGFGPWTVQYIGMRALGWPDAFPHTDYGVKKALNGMSANEILSLSQTWRPWRSYATINLWNSLKGKRDEE